MSCCQEILEGNIRYSRHFVQTQVFTKRKDAPDQQWGLRFLLPVAVEGVGECREAAGLLMGKQQDVSDADLRQLGKDGMANWLQITVVWQMPARLLSAP